MGPDDSRQRTAGDVRGPKVPVLEIEAPLRKQLAEQAAEGGQLNLLVRNNCNRTEALLDGA